MTLTEDRTTALLERPVQQHGPSRSVGTCRPQDPEPAGTSVRRDPDERSMRWALLGSLLLGAYAAAFVLLGVWLTP